MTRLHGTNYAHHAFAPHNFALITDFLNASAYFHWCRPKPLMLFVPIGDTSLGQVVRSHFERHPVAGDDANVVHAHFAGNVS